MPAGTGRLGPALDRVAAVISRVVKAAAASHLAVGDGSRAPVSTRARTYLPYKASVGAHAVEWSSRGDLVAIAAVEGELAQDVISEVGT